MKIYVIFQSDLKKLKIDIEPKFISLGPFHLAIGMNNRAWFYNISDSQHTGKYFSI